MIFEIHASATTASPVRASPQLLGAAMAQYRPTTRVVGSDTVDAVLHVEADGLADALTDGVNALLDALHASGDRVLAASISGSGEDDTEPGDDSDDEAEDE
jgi:triphosphoribosyl-dephospho-CoA synthetase